jgi:O-methyltransferase involved in polyketide biosynthesis
MPAFDPNTPSIARVYDYLLGGKDNFAVDRELGDKLIEIYPPAAETVRENKKFLTRAVTWVAGQGISQFIDLGAGLPTSPTTQETAQAVAGEAKVAYVDNDPVVVTHLQALLAKGHPGVTVVDDDIANVAAVLEAVAAGIDLSAPACLILGSLLHFFPPESGRELLSAYLAALAPGSYLILSLGIGEQSRSSEAGNPFLSTYRQGGNPMYNYTLAQAGSLFDGLEIIPPGIAEVRAWRGGWTGLPESARPAEGMVGAVARVP